MVGQTVTGFSEAEGPAKRLRRTIGHMPVGSPTVSRWTYPSRSGCRDSITAKHQRTKPLCPNPTLHFGVTFSNSGMTATMHEKVTGNWYEYSELDGGASYRIDPVAD